jgi:hypothetical protein
MQRISSKPGWLIIPSLLVLSAVAIGFAVLQFGARSAEMSETHKQVIPSPNGEYVSVAWVSDRLVVDFRGAVGGTPAPPVFNVGRLWQLHDNGENMSMLTAPTPEGCVSTNNEQNTPSSLLAPSRLPDGRLGYIVACPKSSNSPLDDLYMMGLDMHTGREDRLLSYTLPGKRFGVAGYSWNPEMTRGIATDGNGLAEKLYWLTLEELQPIVLPFTRAITPAWSPDGTRIAFWGAPEQGLHGIGKADLEFNLYMMKPNGSDVYPVLTGFKYPLSMSWSPDGRQLVFAALSTSGGEGIWLFTPDTGLASILVSGSFTSLTWSPVGRQIAALEFIPGNSQARLVKIKLEPLLPQADDK